MIVNHVRDLRPGARASGKRVLVPMARDRPGVVAPARAPPQHRESEGDHPFPLTVLIVRKGSRTAGDIRVERGAHTLPQPLVKEGHPTAPARPSREDAPMSALAMGSRIAGDIREEPGAHTLPQPLVKEGHHTAPARPGREDAPMSALAMGSRIAGDIKEPGGHILPQPHGKEGQRITSEGSGMVSREVPGRAMAAAITAMPTGREEVIVAGARQMTAPARKPLVCLGIASPSVPASRFPSSSAPLRADRAPVLIPDVRGREDHTATPNDPRGRAHETVAGRVQRAHPAPIGAPRGHPLPGRRACSAQTTRMVLPVKRSIVYFPAPASVPAPSPRNGFARGVCA